MVWDAGSFAHFLPREAQEHVGEIQDEYDSSDDVRIARQGDGSWVVEGGEAYEHVREVAGIPPIPRAERGLYTTLPGLLMARLGRVPVAGDTIDIGDGWWLKVLTMDGRRVRKVRLWREATNDQHDGEDMQEQSR